MTGLPPEEVIHPSLLEACTSATAVATNVRSRGPLLALFASFKSLNRRSTKAILRTVMVVRPSAHSDIAFFVLAVARAVVRFRFGGRKGRRGLSRPVCPGTKRTGHGRDGTRKG